MDRNTNRVNIDRILNFSGIDAHIKNSLQRDVIFQRIKFNQCTLWFLPSYGYWGVPRI